MLLRLLLGLLLALTPAVASAIQLHWSSGASSLTFTSATRCTLVVEADVSEGVLPAEWRLLWVANHCPHLKPVQDSSFSSPTMAQAVAITPPSPAEELGHQNTAHFEFPGSSSTDAARFVFDLPAGSAGKFKILAATPSEVVSDTPVLESGIVTFNGGVSAPFPSAVLAAAGDHPTSHLTVTTKGVGLGSTTSLALVSPDLSWELPLDIEAATDSTITAGVDVPADLPDAVLQVSSSNGTGSVAMLAAALTSISTVVKGNSWLVVPESTLVTPKDFAFVYNAVPTSVPNHWRGLFHIFYIRHNTHVADGLETSFGHLWSWNLQDWGRDTLAFTTGSVGWDKAHVWAPSIVQNGNIYNMFYTGVDSVGNQSIGRVTTTQLDTSNTLWSLTDRKQVHTYQNTHWVVPHPPTFPNKATQMRDPFVFRHPSPDSANVYFMTYVGLDTLFKSVAANSVGIARNVPGTLDQWIDLGRYNATNYAHTSYADLESPHVFPDSTTTHGGGWRVMFTAAESGTALRHSSVRVVAASDTNVAPADTVAGHWQATPSALYNYLSPDTTVSGWIATEQLRAGKMDFLAGVNVYNFDGIHISRMYWNGGNFSLKVPAVTAVDDAGSPTTRVRLSLVNFRPQSHKVKFRIELPVEMPVRFAVYDVQGRRLRTLADRSLPVGATTLEWDSTDRDGSPVHSGVYFGLLTYGAGTRTAQFPIVR